VEGDPVRDVDSRHREIALPYPVRRHPRGEQFQRTTRQWAHRFGLIRDGRTLEKFDALGYGRLMACASPEARDEDLQLLADWNTLFFVFDDIQDDPLLAGKRAEYEWLRRQVQKVVDRRGRAASGNPVVAAVANLCARTFPGRGTEWERRFALNLETWLAGHAQETRSAPPRCRPAAPSTSASGGCLDENLAGYAVDAMMPFGVGRHRCPGDTFAWAELGVALATILRKWHLVHQAGSKVRELPLVTVQPSGLRMVARRRTA
jgi:hypothetical protein